MWLLKTVTEGTSFLQNILQAETSFSIIWSTGSKVYMEQAQEGMP